MVNLTSPSAGERLTPPRNSTPETGDLSFVVARFDPGRDSPFLFFVTALRRESLFRDSLPRLGGQGRL